MNYLAMQLKDEGMEKAKEHADRVVDGWSERAYEFLKYFVYITSDPFLCEHVRERADACCFPDPPSKRAWGFVMVRAAKEGLIKHCGYQTTSNPKAHGTPASLWVRA